jgi:hypothetical protein
VTRLLPSEEHGGHRLGPLTARAPPRPPWGEHRTCRHREDDEREI